MDVEKEVIILFAVVNDFLSDIPVSQIQKFEEEFLKYVNDHYYNLILKIRDEKKLNDERKLELADMINSFKVGFFQ